MDYEISFEAPARIAKLTFEVMETYKGRAAPTWSVFRSNSTYGLPENLAEFNSLYGEDLVVGLGPWDISEQPEADVVAIRSAFPELFELPWVAQEDCAPPFMAEFERLAPVLRRKGILD